MSIIDEFVKSRIHQVFGVSYFVFNMTYEIYDSDVLLPFRPMAWLARLWRGFETTSMNYEY
jgi:hypothetical protein